MDKKQKKFLVTGFPRSGTTYLSSILNSSQNISCLDFAIERYSESDDPKVINSLISNITVHLETRRIPFIELRNINYISDIKNAFYDHFSNYYHSNIIGTKTTLLNFAILDNCLKSDYKVIYITRDLFSVYKSYLTKFNTDPFVFFLQYKNYLKNLNIERLKKKYHDKILFISYENLVKNKLHEIERLSKFLSLKLDPEAKLYYSFNKNLLEFKTNTSYYKKYDLTDQEIKFFNKFKKFLESRNIFHYPLLLHLKHIIKKII